MGETGTLRFVDLETARASRVLRLAVITSVPSLWSDAARGMVAAKELECLAVDFDPRDEGDSPLDRLPERKPARRRFVEILGLLDRHLARAGGPYFFGSRLSALAFYSAAALG